MTAPERALAELVAKQAVADVLHRYCRGLDRMDRELAGTVWHPGGTADYGPGFRGTGSDFLDYVFAYHEAFECHSHMIGNVLVDVGPDARTAGSETYVEVWLRRPGDDGTVTEMTHRGRYVDRLSERDGVWAVEHRVYVGDLYREVTLPAAGSAPRGRRDREDPSYAVLP